MRKNFKNPKTGEEFSIAEYKTKGDGKYYDKYNTELLDKDGTPLEFIEKEGPIGAPMILGSASERMAKDHAHFKQTAKKHASSEEGRAQKRKVMDKQMGVMGFEKIEKKKK